MPFVRKNAYDNAIQKVKITIGTLLGLEKDDEAYVVLKELPTMEMMKLTEAESAGQKELMEFFKEVLPNIIVSHNLEETEGVLMSNKAVTELIFEKLDLTGKVVGDYSSAAFFTQGSKAPGK